MKKSNLLLAALTLVYVVFIGTGFKTSTKTNEQHSIIITSNTYTVTCRECNGSGKCPMCRGLGQTNCIYCKGTGKNQVAIAANKIALASNLPNYTPQDENCQFCSGTGKVSCAACNSSGVCPKCNGTGVQPQ